MISILRAIVWLTIVFAPAFCGGLAWAHSAVFGALLASLSPLILIAIGVANMDAEGRGKLGPYR